MPEVTMTKLFGGSGLGLFTGDKQAILNAPYGGFEKTEKIMAQKKAFYHRGYGRLFGYI